MRYLAKDDKYMWNVFLLTEKNKVSLHVKQGPGGFGIIIREKGEWMQDIIKANHKELSSEGENDFKVWLFDAVFRGIEEISFI